MKLNTLIPTVIRPKKRVGRGYGSGKGGHNSGRGTKGQKARGKIPAYFVGSSWVWFKRLPFMRGKSKFGSLRETRLLTLSDLNRLAAGTVVTPQKLRESGLISPSEQNSAKIKIVMSGKLDRKLVVAVPASAGAQQAILKAGGEYRGTNI